MVEIYRDAEGVFVHLPTGSPDQQLVYASSIAEAISQAEPAHVVLSPSGQVVDDTSSPLNSPPDSPIVTLIHAIERTGIPLTVVAPRLFLENLFLPTVADAVRKELYCATHSLQTSPFRGVHIMTSQPFQLVFSSIHE